jgi:hypothetical protein
MVEPNFTSYVIAAVFALIGIPFIWAVYRYRELPPDERPGLGTPGTDLGGGGGGSRRWGIKGRWKKQP